jgi:hypothetical protein
LDHQGRNKLQGDLKKMKSKTKSNGKKIAFASLTMLLSSIVIVPTVYAISVGSAYASDAGSAGTTRIVSSSSQTASSMAVRSDYVNVVKNGIYFRSINRRKISTALIAETNFLIVIPAALSLAFIQIGIQNIKTAPFILTVLKSSNKKRMSFPARPFLAPSQRAVHTTSFSSTRKKSWTISKYI